ncbi:MAG: GxxExxY protein, partial [Clostridia bacterium]|nr:GxxExxY protein [Clostridia bacterium]
GLKVERQQAMPVMYERQTGGEFCGDIWINGKVIGELKSVERLDKAQEIQLVNYLVATGMSVGLLINFGAGKVKVKRKLRKLTN